MAHISLPRLKPARIAAVTTLLTIWVLALFTAQTSALSFNPDSQDDSISCFRSTGHCPAEAPCEQILTSPDSIDARTLGWADSIRHCPAFAAHGTVPGVLAFRSRALNSSHLLDPSSRRVRAP
jgi:hypothetical protein